MPDTTDTKINLRDGLAEIRHRKITKRTLSLHIAAWTDREEVSTVPHMEGRTEADLSSEPPGKDWDYLDGDGMILVSGNHYMIIQNKLHPNSLFQYIRNLFNHCLEEKVEIPDEIRNLRLIRVANEKVVKEAYSQGVKKIELNIGQYMETVKQREEVSRKTIVEQLGINVLKSLLTKDSDRKSIEEASNVTAQLVVKIDSRKPGLTADKLGEIAQEIADENEDEISVVTKKGNVIKGGELVLKKKVKITARAKSIHHNQAWEEMETFLQELEELGALEE